MATFENRFTERAEKALRIAHESAMELGHNYVGTEHILLGLLKEGGGVAARVLQNQGITEEKVIRRIGELIGISEKTGEQPAGLTPRTKRVLELSFVEARRMGHNYIGTEHILLGIMREGESVAVRILNDLGLDIQKLYAEIVRLLNEETPGATGAPRASTSYANTPTLNQFGRDLTEMAREGKFDPIIGRDKEIERVIQILSRRTKNNPCLIGEPGVGKTAIAEGLAQKIVEGNIPEILKDKRVVTLDLSSMVAGAKYRGEFEERLKKAMDEIRKAGNVILFIDEMHTIIGAGAAEGAIDASNILKPSLARGELQVIGATTLDEYRKYVEKDAALERRFQPITVGEPTVEETIQILKGIRDKYEAHHRVKITDNALEAAAKLSDRYITDRFLPDKAIDLIDEAASRVRLKTFTAPPDLKQLEERIEKMSKEKEEAIRTQEFEKAAKIRDEEQALKKQLEEMKSNWQQKNQTNMSIVTEEEIAEIISSWTGIPVKRLAEEESERLLKMEEVLHKRVVGQEEAVKAIAKAIRRGRVGLKDPKRPTGSFIFLGPTGVGKTELSKALAEAIFGDEDAMIRIDMSEYMEKHTVSRLVGSPPGYVGYEEGGQLTEKVRRKPYSVVLFDEIEKAHPDVFNILLQILEDGILTDAQGRRVDFRNTIIIMTSNVGARMITEPKKLGFAVTTDERKENYETIKNNVMSELKRTFRPEFLNRIDEIIVFHQLEEEHIKQVATLMLNRLIDRLKANEMTVEVTDAAKTVLAKEGFDPVYGARPLRRAIQSKVEDKLAEEMLEGKIKSGDHVVIDAENDQIVIKKK
ncbi:MAG: ATP-dependent Clp protease ATP-binding subunit ClpC [Petroclostridium sp.]|jgi:ATP-dependent Clp protease ATP-binding subunit ClpC|uniref:ATP-dependent Clp protease ATP-binding subunit n=1 Tax=Petroclostridium xylanilyticum TaxID=1792311 RepID=UPI000B997693|nr:ATP-dependent Clp protease ATP-binding subunit [Petroclostridium xylanilyticum]MBZ4646645.1 ATP-dependent Clp protease ATP-binding subunit ClpC [Clostridia bacterium]MDK2811215.1 ATP-dependent Clp protease ATP-binding subunit ClpC [Petroclostridium sp.]